METPITRRLYEYTEQDSYPFHMPGHKRAVSFLENPYHIDVTELPETDDLHAAEGVILESMQAAAQVYHTRASFYMVNGSTGGLLSAMFAVGGAVLMARNCHKSVYHAVSLLGSPCEYIFPEITPEGICASADCRGLEEKLAECRAQGRLPAMVVITSPTYEGVISDIAGIARIVHAYGAYLIVDEAHGAHLPFLCEAGFPNSAAVLGADFVIQSLHKTLPSLTQTAILHVGAGVPEPLLERLRYYLGVFQSSSPSYVLMAAAEQCIAYMDSGEGRQAAQEYADRLRAFYENPRICAMKHLGLLRRAFTENNAAVYDREPSKLVIVISPSGRELLSGQALAECLRLNYHLQVEMAAPDYVIAMTTVCDSQEGLQRLTEALCAIDGELDEQLRAASGRAAEETGADSAAPRLWRFGDYVGKAVCPIGAAQRRQEVRSVGLEEAVGRVSADFVYLYPPGIPFIAPGEYIRSEAVRLIQGLSAERFKLCGLVGEDRKRIRVLYQIEICDTMKRGQSPENETGCRHED